MNRPEIFISCVSSEFGTTRQQVANALHRMGYTPVFQDAFPTEAGDLRAVLREKIDPCRGLIQIVGAAYGAEPPAADPEFGRVSYTQYEFYYARKKGKKIWLFFAQDAALRDRPVEELDLPLDPGHPDPAAYQTERCGLQQSYVEARRREEAIYYDVDSGDGLLKRVGELEDQLAVLRRGYARWQAGVLALLVALVVLVVAGLLVPRETAPINRERLRAHVLESIEETYAEALAAAETAEGGWEAREKLRETAQREYDASLERIDGLVDDLFTMASGDEATPIMREAIRILDEEGVEQALAYLETKYPSSLAHVDLAAGLL